MGNDRSREQSMSKIYLPLKLWGIVGIIVLISVLILSQDWKNVASDREKNYALNIDRLTKKNGKYHVVALGNSLLYNGLPFDSIIEEKLRQQKLKLRINRLTISGVESDYFVSIFPQIIKAKPDLIILQSEFFFMNSSDSHQRNFYENITWQIAKIKKASRTSDDYNHYINSDPIESIRNKDIKLSCGNTFLTQSEFNRHATQSYRNISININDRLKPYLSFITQAKRMGIKVVFMEMGRSQAANDFLGEKSKQTIEDALTKINVKTESEVWRFPANLPLNHYCDSAHLNDRGQKVFTNWFINQIKTKLNSNKIYSQ